MSYPWAQRLVVFRLAGQSGADQQRRRRAGPAGGSRGGDAAPSALAGQSPMRCGRAARGSRLPSWRTITGAAARARARARRPAFHHPSTGDPGMPFFAPLPQLTVDAAGDGDRVQVGNRTRLRGRGQKWRAGWAQLFGHTGELGGLPGPRSSAGLAFRRPAPCWVWTASRSRSDALLGVAAVPVPRATGVGGRRWGHDIPFIRRR